MLLNCGVGEDLRVKEIQLVHPKGDQSWIFIGRTDIEAETPILWLPDAKSWLIWKDPDAGKDWRWEEKGMKEDEMVGWHHRLDGHGFGWTLGVSDGQRGLACCGSWGHGESDTTGWLNWTDWIPIRLSSDFSTETLQVRREWHDIFKVMKEKNLQPRQLYLARLSFRFNGEIISFMNKWKLRKFSTTRSTLQQISPEECHQVYNKGMSLGRKKRPQPETNKLWMEKVTGRGKHRAKVGNRLHTNTSSKPGMGGESMNAAHWKCNENQEISNLKQLCYRLLYQNPKGTKNWKSTIDNTQTEKKKEYKH